MDILSIYERKNECELFHIKRNHTNVQQFICSVFFSEFGAIEKIIICIQNRLSKQKENLVSFIPQFANWKREMSNRKKTERIFVKLLAVLMVIYSSTKLCECHIAELFFEEEDSPVIVAPSLNLPLAHVANLPTNVMEDNTCHVEFTVLKKAVGHCVKLGKATRACVSGTYIHPFHPDCM